MTSYNYVYRMFDTSTKNIETSKDVGSERRKEQRLSVTDSDGTIHRIYWSHIFPTAFYPVLNYIQTKSPDCYVCGLIYQSYGDHSRKRRRPVSVQIGLTGTARRNETDPEETLTREVAEEIRLSFDRSAIESAIKTTDYFGKSWFACAIPLKYCRTVPRPPVDEDKDVRSVTDTPEDIQAKAKLVKASKSISKRQDDKFRKVGSLLYGSFDQICDFMDDFVYNPTENIHENIIGAMAIPIKVVMQVVYPYTRMMRDIHQQSFGELERMKSVRKYYENLMISCGTMYPPANHDIEELLQAREKRVRILQKRERNRMLTS